MLSLQSVCAGYRDEGRGSYAKIIVDLSVTIEEGETLAVVGASGSGKSTLLKLLAGTLVPETGSITGVSSAPRSVWLAPQMPVLVEFRTGIQNALLGREVSNGIAPDDVAEAKDVLDRLGLVDALAKVPAKLSGGMRRRVSLAQALLSSRPLLLLDEPFAELDGVARQRAEDAIHHARRKSGATIAMVTHDLDSVSALCDRALILAGPPTMKNEVVSLAQWPAGLETPSRRRASSAFAGAVAALQKQILEIA